MASEEIVNLLMSTVVDTFTYMLPIMGFLAGVTFIITWIHSILFGFGRRTFRG